MKNKKGMSRWIWILIILILVGVGTYVLLLGEGELGVPGNNKVEFQRSDFPETISGYILNEFYELKKECVETNYGELCTESVEIRYVSEEESKRITVFLSLVSKGREGYEKSIKESTEKISNGLRKFPAKEV